MQKVICLLPLLFVNCDNSVVSTTNDVEMDMEVNADAGVEVNADASMKVDTDVDVGVDMGADMEIRKDVEADVQMNVDVEVEKNNPPCSVEDVKLLDGEVGNKIKKECWYVCPCNTKCIVSNGISFSCAEQIGAYINSIIPKCNFEGCASGDLDKCNKCKNTCAQDLKMRTGTNWGFLVDF